MSLQFFMIIFAGSSVLISLMVWWHRQAKAKPLPPAPPLDNEKKNSGQPTGKELARILVIEYVPAEMSRADIGGFIMSDTERAELLAAGLVLVKKLPPFTCGLLSSSVFKPKVVANFSRLLSQTKDLEDISPERVRATVAIAIVSLALRDMMVWSGEKVGLPNPILVERHTGIIWAGVRIFHVNDIILQIVLGTDVSDDVAIDMWVYILEILQEGVVNIPGIKTRLPLEGEIF
jgi:hypothetical protein